MDKIRQEDLKDVIFDSLLSNGMGVKEAINLATVLAMNACDGHAMIKLDYNKLSQSLITVAKSIELATENIALVEA